MVRSRPNLFKYVRNLLLVVVLAAWQAAFLFGPILSNNLASATGSPTCTNDTGGPNDVPGQKDLTKMCVDYSGVPTGTLATSWDWNLSGTSGANTMDACNLFDTNGNGNADYAVCVTTTGDPATLQTVTTYSCGDARPDRCTNPITPLSNGTTSCGVSQQNTDPFPADANYPVDTVGACTVQLATVGGASATLIDVCSYPSSQPNSDPSDCIISQPKAGKLQVIKNLIPSTDPGLFNLQVDGTTKAANVGNNGTTGILVYPQGNHTVGETSGTNTSLSGYQSSISCRDLNGTGAVIASGSGTSLQLSLADGAVVVCTITNTASGSITIAKSAQPFSIQSFGFTGTGTGITPFSLVDASATTTLNAKTFSGLQSGAYSFTESAVAGWDLKDIVCSAGSSVQVNGTTVTITLAAGQNVTCTYTNTQRGHLIVQKTTLPAGDPTNFTITASGTGTITGGGVGTVSDATDQTYEVTPGTYSVAESALNGWVKTGDTCQNVVVAPGATATCLLTNTKLARLKIIKTAIPSSPQAFSFSTTGSGLTGFSLIDNNNPLLNNQQFTNLTPGTYSVTENSLTGWDLTGLSCSTGGSRAVNTLNITLAPGADVTCTFTNTERGAIFGTKNQVNSDGSFVSTLSGWTINLIQGGQVVGTTTTAADGSYSFMNLINGTYSLAEVMQNGWTQIYSPSTVNLAAGQSSTGNNFGNFQNGSITGYKFNDLNGDGIFENNEPKLSGWTMTLYTKGSSNLLDKVVSTTQTDATGNYSFTNLVPGPYQVCETSQTGWVQTLPGNNGCYTFTFDQSGETKQAVFGNQGRGTITVIKNVDTTGDGQVDQTNVTNWNWNINGSGNFATGSGNPQTVGAGTYTVSEIQKTDYHVTASSCSGETTPAQPTTSLGVTLSPGENVVCTFTNTRDTGSLTLVKHVINTNGGTASASDFTLHVKQNGVDVAGSPASGSESGTSYNLTTGSYTVSEDTPAAGYQQTSIVCDGQTTAQVSVTLGSAKTCTITNDDIAPRLTVIKHVINDNSGQSKASDFTMTVTATNVAPSASFPGSETGTNVTLNAGSYSVSEGAHTGYNVSFSADCTGTIALGQNKTCTVTNDDIAHPSIKVVKSGPATAHEGDTVTYTFTVTNTGDAPLSGVTVSDSITGIASGPVSGDTNHDGILQTTETWIYTATYVIPIGQLADVVNTVTACANDPSQTTVCSTSTHDLDILHPQITVKKSGPLYGYEGETVGYTFLVTNTGDTTLNNVGVADNIATMETCPSTTLAPLASMTCTASFLIPTPQIANVTNIVTASGTDSLGRTVTAQDTHTLDVLHPALHVDKTGPANAYEGDKVTYTFTVTNTGDIPLSAITVNDSITGPDTYLVSGDTNGNNLLDLGETWIYTADYTIPTPQTTDVTNTVTVCGNDPLQTTVCNTANHTLHVYHPTITVNKKVVTTQEADDGLFNLQIDGNTAGTGANVGDGGTTGVIAVKPGLHTVGETAGTNTFLNGYTASFSEDCLNGQITVVGDEQAVCTITNTKNNVVLQLNKTVNRPAPLGNLVGDTVIYSLTVTDPTTSATSYDTTVTDLPPKNFTYVPGSWTATLTKTDGTTLDLKADGVTTEPTYGSPGIWKLGTLLAGQIVTLTYHALINSNVSPGTYPDLAFTTGFNAPSTFIRQQVIGGCVGSCATGTSTGAPFVSTAVAVITPAPSAVFAGQVLGTSILVNTGEPLKVQLFVIPALLLTATGLLWRRSRRDDYKGVNR